MAGCCGDCIHNAVCAIDGYICKCEHFKNKTDFVEVVQCADCTYAHYHEDAKAFCCKRRDWYSEFVRPTDFCSHGVKNGCGKRVE
jgi:hypothetical protein